MLMTPNHEKWPSFFALLEGPEGCNFRDDAEKGWTWTCYGNMDKRFAEAILREHFPDVDVEGSLEFFEEHGGHCDCEILLNVEANVKAGV